MLAKAKKGLANIQTPNLDNSLWEKNTMCVKGYLERKIMLSKTYADITGLDGSDFQSWNNNRTHVNFY